MQPADAPDLYIARSPLQLLNCIEARAAFRKQAHPCVLIAAWRAERDRIMMQHLLDWSGNWTDVHFFPLYPVANQLRMLQKVLAARRHFASLVIGDSTQLLNFAINRLVQTDRVIMVDDGTATLARAEMIASETLHRYKKNLSRANPLAASVRHALGFSPAYLYRATLFTMYDLQAKGLAGRIVRNRLALTAADLASRPQGEEVWFIGSNIRRELLLDRDRYEVYLEQVAEIEDMSKLIYIPHRKEPDDYLAHLKKRFGMTIRRFDAMIELEMINTPRLPARFVSFGSSALDTLQLLIDPRFDVYRIPSAAVIPHRRQAIDAMYQSYIDRKIPVRALRLP